jgi:hypothetical protein
MVSLPSCCRSICSASARTGPGRDGGDAALLGSALLTLAIGFLGGRYDHQSSPAAAAGLMVAPGVAFAVVERLRHPPGRGIAGNGQFRRPAA